MTQRKASDVRVGPDPKDQQEEREARIAEMLARIKRHQDQAAYHLEQADYHQREADRLKSTKRPQAEGSPPPIRKRH
jgi:hypothetical protein